MPAGADSLTAFHVKVRPDGKARSPRRPHVALLDADILAYQVASQCEKRVRWSPDEPVDVIQTHDEAHAFREADRLVSEWTEGACCREPVICLSCPTDEGFRFRKVSATYKGNRSDVVKPLLLQTVKDYLEARYPSFRRPELEADDIMGILAAGTVQLPVDPAIPSPRVIVSADKDMQTIPGLLWNPSKDAPGVVRRISPEAAMAFWFYQALAGDATDYYPGCRRVGDVRAAKIIMEVWDDCTPWADQKALERAFWARVVQTYLDAGSDEATALQQARLARILRAEDYDFTRKEPRLWTPPPRTV